MGLLGSRESSAPGLDWDRDGPWRSHADRSDRRTLAYDGETYLCRQCRSPDGTWRLAYGSAVGGDRSVVFLFEDEELRWRAEVDHPIVGLVANDGAVLVLEGGTVAGLDGAVRTFDAAGDPLVSRTFEANVADGDLSADGAIAAVRTHPPDETTYLFDLRTGDLTATHTSEWAQPTTVRIVLDGDRWYAYLSTGPESEPLYAIESDGSVAWRSKRYRTMQPLSTRLRERFLS